MRETVKAPGLVRPEGENTLLQSEAGGRLTQVLLRPNQTVRRGQLLAVFETTALRSEERQLHQEIAALQRQARQAQEEQQSLISQVEALESLARSLTETSRRSVDQARASLAFEQRQLQRYAALVQAGAVPQQLVEEKQARHWIGQAELAKAQQGVSEQRTRGASELARLRQSASQARMSADEWTKQLAQRQARLNLVQRQIEQASVHAPISGAVLQTPLRHAGQVLQPGAMLAVLAPATARFTIQLLVPPDAISQVRSGQPATLRLAACPSAEFGVLQARVTSVGADTQQLPSDTAGGGSGYAVELQPQSTGLSSRQGRCALKPGMRLSGDVVTRRTTVLAFLLNKLRLDQAS
jgi:multidrug resistance efflux pump